MANKNEYDWAIDRLQDMRELDTTLSFDDEALELAIRSLKAWEKVKEEVEDKIGNLDDELKNGEVCLSYYYGKLAGLSEALEIIDKYLKEVVNDD